MRSILRTVTAYLSAWATGQPRPPARPYAARHAAPEVIEP